MPIDFAAPAGEATVTVTVTVVDLDETSFVADRDAPGMPGYGCRCGQGCGDVAQATGTATTTLTASVSGPSQGACHLGCRLRGHQHVRHRLARSRDCSQLLTPLGRRQVWMSKPSHDDRVWLN